MAYGTRATFDPLREVGFAGIGAAFAALGPETDDYTRQVAFHNSTDTDIYVSLNGTTTHLRIAAHSAQIHDITTNKVQDDGLFIAKKTIFYIKQTSMGAPTTGNFWIQVLAAEGGK